MKAELRTLHGSDLEAYLALRRVAFGLPVPRDPERLGYYLERFPYSRGLFLGGDLASVATLYPLTAYVARKRHPVGGLAGIMTAPQHRRQGHVRTLLYDALEQLHEGGVGWCLEYPFDPTFYARFGWQSVPSGVLLMLPLERLPAADHAAADVRAATALEPAELARLKPIYQAWAQQFTFTLSRDDPARAGWQRLVRLPWEEHDRLVYLLDDAYCFIDLDSSGDRPVLDVTDFAYASPTGRQALFAFLSTFRGQVEAAELFLPLDDPLVSDYLGWFPAPPRKTLQARIVDVGAALAELPAVDERTFTMRLHDDFCGWNDGTFRVTLSPTGSRVSRARGTPDITLDIRGLCRLLSGAVSARRALGDGLVAGDEAVVADLASITAGAPTFMPLADFF